MKRKRMSGSTLFDLLPDENIIQILIQTSLQDIIRICLVNKRFNQLCHDESIWLKRIKEDFPDFLPLFGQEFKTRHASAMHMYRYLDQNYLRKGFERELMIKLNRGDEDIRSFILNRLELVQLPTMKFIISLYRGEDCYISINSFDRSVCALEEVIKYKSNYIVLNKQPGQISYSMSPLYLILITSIYLSTLYRLGISINFCNITNIYKYDPKNASLGNYSTWPKIGIAMEFESPLDYVFSSGKGFDEYGLYLIQAFHSYSIIERKLKLMFDPNIAGDISLIFLLQEITENDLWRGKRLIDADYWVYKVGETMLYLRKTKYIIKFIPVFIEDKLTHPYLFRDPSPPIISKENEQSFKNMEQNYKSMERMRFWRNILNDVHRFFKIEIGSFFKKLAGLFGLNLLSEDKGVITQAIAEIIDPYYLLQSPHFVGKFMYPKELTPNSKVIIIGEI